MENKHILSVGQVLFEDKGKDGIVEWKVARIGRIYFTNEGSDKRFLIETLQYKNRNYSQNNIKLYFTKDEILEIKEHSDLLRKLQQYFRWDNVKKPTIQQLRTIALILEL